MLELADIDFAKLPDYTGDLLGVHEEGELYANTENPNQVILAWLEDGQTFFVHVSGREAARLRKEARF